MSRGRDESRDVEARDAGERAEYVRVGLARFLVRPSDIEAMETIGKFRTVASEDLAHFHFKGNASHTDGRLRELVGQGLVGRRTLQIGREGRLEVLFLTKQGQRLVKQERQQDDSQKRDPQAVYAGLKKFAEIAHDAAIYRMYQAEAARIVKLEGRVRRVVLDYEFKKRVYSPLAKARGLPPEEYRKLQDEVARDNGLAVVDGKILLPDLRIEYETREGEMARVDLELATDHYKPGQLRDKARAGFRIYRMAQDRSGSSAVWEDRELTAEILSL